MKKAVIAWMSLLQSTATHALSPDFEKYPNFVCHSDDRRVVLFFTETPPNESVLQLKSGKLDGQQVLGNNLGAGCSEIFSSDSSIAMSSRYYDLCLGGIASDWNDGQNVFLSITEAVADKKFEFYRLRLKTARTKNPKSYSGNYSLEHFAGALRPSYELAGKISCSYE